MDQGNSVENNLSSLEDLQRRLDKSGYQKFILPGDVETKGVDRSATADAVFSFDLKGKTVLDIGCLHGFYLIEAKKRGAAGVVGVEADKRRVEIARRIQEVFGFDQMEFVRGFFPRVRLKPKRFDVTLLLNVVHHYGTIRKAAAAIKKAAAITDERLILCVRPPAEEREGIDRKRVIEAVELIEHRWHLEKNQRWIERKALLGRRFIEELLEPYTNRVEFADAPDYPGRFIAVGHMK